jgi:hypothetical protein
VCVCQARCSLPSNFDCNLAYTLGMVAGALVNSGYTGYAASVSGLEKSPEEWEVSRVGVYAVLHPRVFRAVLCVVIAAVAAAVVGGVVVVASVAVGALVLADRTVACCACCCRCRCLCCRWRFCAHRRTVACCACCCVCSRSARP